MRPQAYCILAASVLATAPAVAQDGSITLASTTSTEQSGLFNAIHPQFTEATGIEVNVVAVGTGQALEIARRGDADHLLVHDKPAEIAMVEDGPALSRADVMYNDFVIVGPESDPAGLSDIEDMDAAMQAIADAEAEFASRGDDSGTHRTELDLWESAGIAPQGESWYLETGSGMGPTLNTAAGANAYALTDRATWIAFDNRQTLEIQFENDPALFNQYGSVLIDPAEHPHINHEAAETYHEWLLSEEGQAAIAAYELRGQQLFVPNAE